MEEQDDEIVVRQKLVTDEIENDMDEEQINLNSTCPVTAIAAKSSSSILPILSNISNNNKENFNNIKENNSKHNKTKNLITVTGIAPISSPILSIKVNI